MKRDILQKKKQEPEWQIFVGSGVPQTLVEADKTKMEESMERVDFDLSCSDDSDDDFTRSNLVEETQEQTECEQLI